MQLPVEQTIIRLHLGVRLLLSVELRRLIERMPTVLTVLVNLPMMLLGRVIGSAIQ
jgi:hypothetical protein